MKAESVTFFCDDVLCLERFTAVTEGSAAWPYDLYDAGWQTVLSRTKWYHYCPAHVTKSYRQDRGHDDRAGGLAQP